MRMENSRAALTETIGIADTEKAQLRDREQAFDQAGEQGHFVLVRGAIGGDQGAAAGGCSGIVGGGRARRDNQPRRQCPRSAPVLAYRFFPAIGEGAFGCGGALCTVEIAASARALSIESAHCAGPKKFVGRAGQEIAIESAKRR